MIFLSVYVLQQNNQFERVQQILDKWLLYNANDLALLWAQAFLDGDIEKLGTIASAQPKKREPLPYEILFEDRSFPFIKQMYKKNFFKMTYTVTK